MDIFWNYTIHLSVTYPIHYCQRNAHVESAVSEVNSLWAIDENAIVERLHPVSVTALQLQSNSVNALQ